VALVQVLAQRVILDGYGGASINISASPQDRLSQIAPDIDESPAARGLERVREAWVARLPSDPEALFAELLAMEQEELLSLLALCVGRTVAAFASSARMECGGTEHAAGRRIRPHAAGGEGGARGAGAAGPAAPGHAPEPAHAGYPPRGGWRPWFSERRSGRCSRSGARCSDRPSCTTSIA